MLNFKAIAYHFVLFLGLFVTQLGAQDDILFKLKKALPNASFEELDNGHHFKREFIIMLEQPLDHNDPSAGSFEQRLFLAHYDFDEPMLMVTEGYSAYPRYYELSDMIMSNQLIIEYRFFGKSKPANYDYKYLSNNQAAEDYHRIRNLLGKVYKKDWISTGISKGGTTCLIYKYKYPDDVKVTVPYVAPLPMGREDKRFDQFFETVGTEECRNQIIQFQKDALALKDSIFYMVDSLSQVDSIHFKIISIQQAFEYAVLEYPFSFWQYGQSCNRIPKNPDKYDVFKHLNSVVGFDFYADETIEYFKPSFYQFMTENGYYGFQHAHLGDNFDYVTDFTNFPFAPPEAEGRYNADYLKYVRVFLYHKGEKIIYIYGAIDPWTVCKLVPPKERDAVFILRENGDHSTRISTISKVEQKIVETKLSQWLKRKIIPIQEVITRG